MHCNPCRITTGFSGAGAFSDGKLSLSHEVGGDLPDLIGADLAQKTIGRVDQMYLDFGADVHVEGVGHPDEVAQIRRRAIKAGLKLVDCPIRHLGTEKAQELYARIEQHLEDVGVDLVFSCECEELLIEDGVCRGAVVHDASGSHEVFADETVVATGRRGAAWLDAACTRHGIEHSAGPCDLGVRVEVRNEVMETVNDVLYEGKLVGRPRTRAASSRRRTTTVGLRLSTATPTRSASPTTPMWRCSPPSTSASPSTSRSSTLAWSAACATCWVRATSSSSASAISWTASAPGPARPDAEAGDITAAIPYRAMIEIVNFIKAVDEVVPGFAAEETLLYAPELKFYSNRVKMTPDLETSVEHLRCLGDSSGWTRGLMMASVMGLLCGEALAG